jgi:nitroreductase
VRITAVCAVGTVEAMPPLELTPDQLLSTTRAVRKRLDFDRPVPDDLIRECVALALQAPSGSNTVTMQFVVVRDEEKKQAIGRLYGEAYEVYRNSPGYAGARASLSEADQAVRARVASSADYLGEHMGEAPALVIGCNVGETRDAAKAGMGNILPGMWSFMLAARARALGTAWTTIHLAKEREVAELLGIPFGTVKQAVLTPIAFTKGTDFKPAPRPGPDEVIHWDAW